jgi:predicted kinase
MKHKIVSLRGTSGSGKSTVAFTLFKNFPREDIVDDQGKIKGYVVDASSGGIQAPIYVLGKYTTQCGGCDQIPTQQEAADRAVHYHQAGHVLMEGLLASAAGPVGAVTATIQQTGEAVFAILDTPVDVCIERVKARRAARGDEREFNPKNTKDKWTQTMSTAKALHMLGYDVRGIDHNNAYEEVMNIFREAERESV